MKLSKQELERIFEVDFDTGQLRWNVSNNRRIRVGSIAGNKKPNGYYQVRFKGKSYLLHRIIYQMAYGDLTDDFEIDHIDNNPSNNSLSNLRKCTRSQNMMNRKGAAKNSKIGVRGLREWTHHKTNEKYWRCEVYKEGEYVFNKYYPQSTHTLAQVTKIVEEQRKIHFGEYKGN